MIIIIVKDVKKTSSSLDSEASLARPSRHSPSTFTIYGDHHHGDDEDDDGDDEDDDGDHDQAYSPSGNHDGDHVNVIIIIFIVIILDPSFPFLIIIKIKTFSKKKNPRIARVAVNPSHTASSCCLSL